MSYIIIVSKDKMSHKRGDKMTAEERAKARLVKQVGEKLVRDGWFWRGTEYISFGWCGLGEITAYVRFTTYFNCLKVEIDLRQYRLPDKEEKFTGESAMADAVHWTAETLYELYKTIEERISPFVKGKVAYEKALRGE